MLYAGRIAAARVNDEAAGTVGATAGGSPSASGPVRSRQEAFQRLQQVADFFEQMDPQCLLAAHIRRIVRLGNMTVTEYFCEIVEDKERAISYSNLSGLILPRMIDSNGRTAEEVLTIHDWPGDRRRRPHRGCVRPPQMKEGF